MNEDLIKAAEHIDQYGWIQGDLRDDEGRVCLYGALDAVTNRNTIRKHSRIGKFEEAKKHLRNYITSVRGIRTTIDVETDNVVYLNDFILTSAEEASKVLREAAEWTPDV